MRSDLANKGKQVDIELRAQGYNNALPQAREQESEGAAVKFQLEYK